MNLFAKRIDVRGCWCSDCEKGVSIPAQDATVGQLLAAVRGEMEDNSEGDAWVFLKPSVKASMVRFPPGYKP